jgi:hypothetical protein
MGANDGGLPEALSQDLPEPICYLQTVADSKRYKMTRADVATGLIFNGEQEPFADSKHTRWGSRWPACWSGSEGIERYMIR